PYRGLEPFMAEDAARFFGREAATTEVLARLDRLAHSRQAAGALGLLVVAGPSGSGKSSLLRAGVEASVRAHQFNGRPDWSTTVVTPGDAPGIALRGALAGRTGGPHLLIVDQLEELFAAPVRERQRFLEQLARLRAPDTLVLAGLRADFYGAAAREPLLLPVLREHLYLLGPMSEAEVRSAIIEPAKQAGVLVEDGLVDLLLADLAPAGSAGYAHDAGALPLLSHALLATWERAQRNRLTVADYRAAGGLRGAISQSAEMLYGSLDRGERERARRIFMRLVRLDEDAPLTRRRVSASELDDASTVLDRFIAARLVTADATSVEITHEALLTAWPRLAKWIERDRASLRLHRQLTDAANSWAAADGDPSLLLRGTRLALIGDWASGAPASVELNRTEREFLAASRTAARAERQAAHRRTRRMQQLLTAVVALAVAASVLAIVALNASQSAEQARNQALSRQVAIEASDLRKTDPALAMQLALAAYRIAPTVQATSALLDASAGEMPTRLLGPMGPSTIAVSKSGHVLAVAYSNRDLVRVYSLSTTVPRQLAALTVGPHSDSTFAVALNAAGTLLAAGGTDHRVSLWSLTSPGHPRRLATLTAGSGTVYGLSFSPGGGALAAADADGTVARWSLAKPSHPAREPALRAPGHPALQAVAYSPAGTTVAAAGANGAVVVWSAHGSTRPLAALTAAATTMTTVAYSPNGSTLAAGAQDALVYLWRVGTGGALEAYRAPLHGFSSWVDSLAFSRSGRYLAAGDSDETLRVWSTSSWRQIGPPLPHPAPVTGIAFSASDRQLISVDENGTTRLWQFPPPSTYTAPGGLYTIDYTANAHELAAVSGGPGGDVELWNVADPERPRRIESVHVPGSFGPVAAVGALSPNGKLLAVGDAAAKVQLISLARPHHPRMLGRELTGAVPYIEQVDFSPNMRLLSVGDDAGRIHMWDIVNPSHPVALPTIDQRGTSSNVFGIAYSPNNRLMAVACADNQVWLWDIANPHAPRLLARLKGFSSYAYTVAFSPNGRVLAAGSADDTVRLWDVSRPSAPRLLARLTGPTSTVYQVAISPQGSILAASTTDGQVWLWSIAVPSRPLLEATLTAATGEVYDVNFSPDGRTLVAGGTAHTMTFWNFHPVQVASRICSLAGSPVTRAEWSQYVQGAAYDPPCR
ncbi:MAG: hypothetical protein M0T77_11490, partial [Actinomycetota bacterium]|nr:hypothetical protein [Actinomycetota bacterium]